LDFVNSTAGEMHISWRRSLGSTSAICV
jgi:hypothetical protein